VIARATTTVSVLGGDAVDPVFQDTMDADTVLRTGVLASLIESQRTARQPGSDNPRIIRTHIARVGCGEILDETNSIKDESTNEVYAIVSVTRNANPQSRQDLRLDLKRTGPAA
jgi:hypothetical protein